MSDTDNHFSQFAASLSNRLARYALDPDLSHDEHNDQLLTIQRDQLTRLLSLEAEFRGILVDAGVAEEVYSAFLNMIRTQKRNILAARSYFRERQKVFTGGACSQCEGKCCDECFNTGKVGIGHAIATANIPALLRYHPNIQFIQFALRCRRWTSRTERVLRQYKWWSSIGGKPAPRVVAGEARMLEVLRAIFEVRNELVESNIPLVIERAMIFGRRTPPSHLTRMDLVQIAADGLMAAVDKLVLEEEVPGGTRAWDGGSDEDVSFTKEPGSVFRSVAIGRMVGNLIEQYSSTLVHFFPGDRRKIYRANKAGRIAPKADLNYDDVVRAVNTDPKTQEEVPAGQRTTVSEIVDLMGASSCVSMVDEEGHDQASKFAAAETWRPDHRAERAELRRLVAAEIHNLPLIEQKLLALSGISL